MKKFSLSHLLIIIIGTLSAAIIIMLVTINFGKQEEVIYFVSKTSSENSTFWHSVERGVKVAADELGIELIFVGPEREIDLEDQIQLVLEGIKMKPSAIILAASDYNALADISQKVIANRITFLTVDSDVNIAENHSFIATNNINAAKQLGEVMGSYLNGTGEVGIISHLEGTTSAIDRKEGFRQGISQFEGISIIDETPYSSNNSQIAYDKTIDFIHRFPNVKGLFGTNEATLIGIAKAVDDLNLKDKIMVVGFDISKEAAIYLEKDIIQAIIVQRPFNMGYLSVQEAYNQNKNHSNTRIIDVDIVLVTKENMFEEENQKFIIPFLD